MRRRAFLGSVGAAAAGMAVGLRPSRARADASLVVRIYREAHRSGRPVIVATAVSEPDKLLVQRGQDVTDLEDRVRLNLIAFVWSEGDAVRRLTNDRSKIAAPSLALIEGQPARLVREAKIDRDKPERGFAEFLRAAMPLTIASLRPRVAWLARHRAHEVAAIRKSLAAGWPPGDPGVQLPAVIALEALRRDGAAREQLFTEIIRPLPVNKEPPREEMDDCGMSMLLINPLGARFVDAFTRQSSDDERGRRS